MSFDSLMNSIGNGVNTFVNGVKNSFKDNKIEVVSKENLIVGIALMALGFITAITGSPIFGTILIISGIGVALIAPDIEETAKKISEIFNRR